MPRLAQKAFARRPFVLSHFLNCANLPKLASSRKVAIITVIGSPPKAGQSSNLPLADSHTWRCAMPLPFKFPSFIYGIHDPGNWMDRVQSTGRQGWVLYTEEVRENTSGNNYSASEQRGFGVLVRLN